MKYCKTCLQTDTRPGISFSKEGICSACDYRRKEFPEIDWNERYRELQNIVDWAKENSKESYDCVIGVSGGKDSTFQAIYAKEQLDLNVLLVNTAPDNITDVGRDNLENLVQNGFDLISFRPNPIVMRNLTRRSFFEYGNPVKPSEYPLYAVPYQIAVMCRVPLIIWGENVAITLGVTGLGMSGNALSVLAHNTLEGIESKDYWLQDGLTLKDLLPYKFPDVNELNKNHKAIYLNYYVKEWGWKNNTDFAIARGLKGREDIPEITGRINPYNSVDADIQIVNQMMKYYKLGFGFVTDEVCYYIREGIMSRNEAIGLVKKYDGKCGEHFIKTFCNYINITLDEFWSNIDKHVNNQLFYKDNSGKWIPKFDVGEDFESYEI